MAAISAEASSAAPMEPSNMPSPPATLSAETSTRPASSSEAANAGPENCSSLSRDGKESADLDCAKASSMPPPPPMPPRASDSAPKPASATASPQPASIPSSEPRKEIQQARDEKGRTFSSSIYSIPSWSAAPAFPFTVEVIKDGAIVSTFEVSSKGAYMFGRSDQCDFVMEHPSISRFHAVLQFKRNGEAFIYDLGSTHGTIMNKKQLAGRTYVPIHVGDVLKLGLSSRLFLLQGPAELMPKEGPSKGEGQILREHQNLFDMAERDASLLRAKREAEGATWGMMEDAIEEDIQEEELTWQTYKGQLTEKQQKTLDKIHKRNEKVASLKREIDAIQVKEIPQGGLTQGQQTQVARNQQRIEQLMEELDNLEETLNQSIQESTGARARKGPGKKGIEEEDGDSSDSDDFYDRTSFSKQSQLNKGSGSTQVVETAESLLEKRANIVKEIERLNQLLGLEDKTNTDVAEVPDSQDPLDLFMSTVSIKIESDRASSLKQEIEKQQADLNRILFLLKVADPSGEAQKKWQPLKSEPIPTKQTNQVLMKEESVSKSKKEQLSSNVKKNESKETNLIENMKSREANASSMTQDDDQQGKVKPEKVPLWLGHKKSSVEKKDALDITQETSTNEKDFIEYKERHTSVLKVQEHDTTSEIPKDACGLILRKPKDDVEGLSGEDKDADKRIWEGAALAAADTVAMLLRHQRGLGAIVDDEIERYPPTMEEVQSVSKKRKLGPERPEFLNREEGKFHSWVPPAGQTGDGKTSLNEKYGY